MDRACLLVAVGAALALALGGCGGGGGEPEQAETVEFQPLAVDNIWTYNFTDYTVAPGASVVRAAARPRRGLFRKGGVGTRQLSAEDIWRVTGTEEIGGHDWFVLVAQYVGGDPSAPIYMRHDAQGLLFREEITDAGRYLLREPLEVGNTWGDPLDARYEWNITGVAETVSVPAGVFDDCVMVDDIFRVSGEPDDTITRWYARGVGLVREEHHYGDALEDELELLSYTLAE